MKYAKFTMAIMERLRSNGWTLPAMVEEVGSNPTGLSFFFLIGWARRSVTIPERWC